jgi:Tfp pilus assembly protein PilO
MDNNLIAIAWTIFCFMAGVIVTALYYKWVIKNKFMEDFEEEFDEENSLKDKLEEVQKNECISC